jgi:anti-sigma B factor antagonist
MSTPPGKLSVLVCKSFACVKIAGRANYVSSPDFKTLLTELLAKGYRRFIIDLSECVLMDSTFLGVLAGFGLKMPPGGSDQQGIELRNANARVAELLENLGVTRLFEMTGGALQLPGDIKNGTSEPPNPTYAEIARTCLEAHQTLMTMNPENAARFKDVAQFLAEDLKTLEKRE